MFRFLSGIPRRLKNILSHFKKHQSQTPIQQLLQNRTISDERRQKRTRHNQPKQPLHKQKRPKQPQPIHHKPKMDNKNPTKPSKNTTPTRSHQTTFHPHQPNTEHRSIDDTVCRKYSTQTEMTCYNHSSTMATS